MPNQNRRRFLEDSMFAATAAAAAAWHANPANLFAEEEKQGDTGPNDKLSVAVVGARGRGGDHIGNYLNRKDCEITYIVDPDEKVGNSRAEEIRKKQGRTPKVVADMRQAFDDKELDIVSVATPNHWHALAAIWAMQAGKDVYVEKPVSHNVSEGRRAVEVARKYKKICQTGTQSRTMGGMREAIKFIHDGGIGKVEIARGLCYKRRGSIGARGDYKVPENVNYDIWCGPAPIAPLTRKQFHYDWHWQWPYGNGDLGNQGIHQVDIARWGLNVDKLPSACFSFGGRIGYEDAGDTANTQSCLFDYGDKTLVFEVRGLETKPFMGAMVGNIFHGTDGYVVMTSYNDGAHFSKTGEKLKEFHGGGNHYANFLDAVRSRDIADLHADILEGHLSSAICHLANISYRQSTNESTLPELKDKLSKMNPALTSHELLSRMESHLTDNKLDPASQKLAVGADLKFDPDKEVFIENSAADAMLTREYRAPYVVPTSDKI